MSYCWLSDFLNLFSTVTFGITGASFGDYTVMIDDVRAEPLEVTADRLTVQWPDSKPLGLTVVSYMHCPTELLGL